MIIRVQQQAIKNRGQQCVHDDGADFIFTADDVGAAGKVLSAGDGDLLHRIMLIDLVVCVVVSSLLSACLFLTVMIYYVY